jgi:hypothetical protein
VKIQALVAVIRDLVLLAVGVFGIIHQEITGHVNLDLLVLYGALIGTPGAVGAVQLLRGSETPARTTTSSSPSAPSSSVEQSS